jgi:hypothetical protein
MTPVALIPPVRMVMAAYETTTVAPAVRTRVRLLMRLTTSRVTNPASSGEAGVPRRMSVDPAKVSNSRSRGESADEDAHRLR